MLLKKNAYLLLILPLALLAMLMDWQYDEAWTYFEVEKNTLPDILSYSTYSYANNHVINSLYFKIAQFFDFSSPIFYRVLSITGFGLFVVANRKILQLFKLNPWFLVPICVAPYFMYFAMGRGYGLALGIFAVAFYLVLNAIDQKHANHLVLASFLLSISAVSNFSFVFIANALFLFIVLHQYRHGRQWGIILNCVLYLPGLLYVIKFGQKVSNFDSYIIGSESFFANGTVQSLLGEFSYSKLFLEAGIAKLPMILVAIAFVWLFILIIRDLFKNSDGMFIRIILGTMLFALIQIALSNLFMESLFPIKRATMFLQYGVLLLAVLVTKTFHQKWVSFFPIALLFLLSAIHVTWLYVDLKKPSLSEVLATSQNHSLYHVGHNPALTLENHFQGNRTTLFQHYEISETLTAIKQDSTSTHYLFLPQTASKSVPLSKELIIKSRNHYALYKITE